MHPAFFYILLFIIVWVPLPLGSNRPWAWSVMEFFIFGLGASLLVIGREQIWHSLAGYKQILLIWLALLIVLTVQVLPVPGSIVSLLSPHAYELQNTTQTTTYYFSIDIGQSRIALLKSTSYFVFFICLLLLIHNTQRLKVLLTTLFASAVFQALYGTSELLFGLDYSLIFNLKVGDAVTGSFVYKNHYANFIMLGLAAGIGLMVANLQESKPYNSRDFLRSFVNALLGNKALIRISIAILVIALVMSKSRMGNVAFFVAMTTCGILALILIKNRTKGLTILIISMFVIDLFIVSAYFGLGKVQERLTQTSLAQESRDEVVSDSLPIITDFPVIGSGAGSYYSIFPGYKQAEVHSFYDHAHNDYLQSLIENGVVATLLLASIVLLTLRKAIFAMRDRKMSIMKGGAFSSAMAIVGMLIHMLVDFPTQSPANALYFISFLALGLIVSHIRAIPIPKQD
ncbi:O-antigen ligase family protein [Aliiglaciecola sp. M165]|nr:O-antigen ligase family protein [Aliiglaciecola sp. M165]